MLGIRASNAAALARRAVSSLSTGVLGLVLVTVVPTGAAEARKKKDEAEAAAEAPAAAAKVVVKDKTELRADPSDNGKVLKKLRGKDKLDFVERSPDGKWAKVKKSKVEGWVAADLLDGLPAQSATATASKPAEATKDVPPPTPVEKPPEKKPEPTPVVTAPPKPPEPVTPPAPVEKPAPVVARTEPVTPAKPVEPSEASAPRAEKLPLSGFWLSIGGGAALLDSGMSATTTPNGLTPELFNYKISTLPALGLQARLGYTFGYKLFRVGVDAGYRFAGATAIVINLPNRDPYPLNGGSTAPLITPRQEVSTTAHDADAAFSIGAAFALPKRLDLSIRARAGFELFAFIPELNNNAALPQEIFYGPHVGGVLEFQSRFVPGFGLRAEGGYIPYAVRTQNTGLRDGQADSSNGWFAGGSIGARIIRGFDVEVAYRILSTSTTYKQGSDPERLRYDRDPNIRALYMMGEKLDTGSRSTAQQTLTLNLVFFRN
ncbi:MAG: SH3 domain-containing protein [Polyangia bacterium]